MSRNSSSHCKRKRWIWCLISKH